MTIGGSVVVHNAVRHDYCLKECVLSLLPAVDRMVIVECGSDDGTRELAYEIQQGNPEKVSVIHRPWVPSGNFEWLKNLSNEARQFLRTDWWFTLDADELIHENDVHLIRQWSEAFASSGTSAATYRYTFWNNHRTILKDGVVCATRNVRLAPIKHNMSGDLIDIPGAQWSKIRIYHYGHIRREQAWIEKSVKCHQWMVNNVPEHWRVAERTGDASGCRAVVGPEYLDNFNGTHPRIIHTWLKERGYEP